jgi:hypothetical protein
LLHNFANHTDLSWAGYFLSSSTPHWRWLILVAGGED